MVACQRRSLQTDPIDWSGTWFDYSGAIPNWNYGGNFWVPFLLDTTGNGVTHYMVYDQSNAVMYDGDIQLPGWNSKHYWLLLSHTYSWRLRWRWHWRSGSFYPVSAQYPFPYGGWVINNSSTGQTTSVQWGNFGDIAISATTTVTVSPI